MSARDRECHGRTSARRPLSTEGVRAPGVICKQLCDEGTYHFCVITHNRLRLLKTKIDGRSESESERTDIMNSGLLESNGECAFKKIMVATILGIESKAVSTLLISTKSKRISLQIWSSAYTLSQEV